MMLWIQHGIIHPMTGAAPFAADIQIEDGRILKLVPPDAHPAKASLLDAAGLHIWPGFLDPRTHLGLTEDHPERPDPSDTAFAQAAAAGVTAVAVCPAPSVPAPRKCSFWQTGRVPEPINAPETFIYPMEGMTEAALHHTLAEAKERHQRIRLVACTPSELALALRLHAELGGDVALEHRATSDALLPGVSRRRNAHHPQRGTKPRRTECLRTRGAAHAAGSGRRAQHGSSHRTHPPFAAVRGAVSALRCRRRSRHGDHHAERGTGHGAGSHAWVHRTGMRGGPDAAGRKPPAAGHSGAVYAGRREDHLSAINAEEPSAC